MITLGFAPNARHYPCHSTCQQEEGTDCHYKIAGDFEFYLRILGKKKINYKIVDDVYVVMQHGGVSTQSFKSNFISSKEILNSFKENKIYNNWFFILLRFPYKIIQFIIKK